MKPQQDTGKYLIQSFKTVADYAFSANYPINIQLPANSPIAVDSGKSIFRTTDE